MILLGDIAQVRVGHTFRSGLATPPTGGVAVLQSRNVTTLAGGGDTELARTLVPRVDDHLLTASGDVVFLPRGVRFPAILVRPDLASVLVASPLYLVRPDLDRVDGAYLAVLLNTTAIQAELGAHAKGSYIPQVPVEAIRGLCLPLPPLHEQRAIAALAGLVQEEAQLAVALAAQRSVWLHALAVHRQATEPEWNSRRHANAPG